MDYRTQLLALAETYGAATGRSMARVATLAVNQGAFFDRLRNGSSCSVDTYLAVKAWFAENWPADATWPEGVHGAGSLPDADQIPDASEAA